MSFVITLLTVLVLISVVAGVVFYQYRKILREAKNYERGLKMVPLYIHIPPSSDDIEGGGRDERDLTEEVLSQAQVMYNIIASTATKGFKSKVYGQRHMSFEVVAHEGLVHYYAVVPVTLVDVIHQAIAAAYPSARLEEVAERNIFNPAGRIAGTVGGEFTLKKDFVFPIATYQETKRDAARALLNALSAASREDGVGVQILLRPAHEGWTKASISHADKIKKDKGVKKASFSSMLNPRDLMEALWKPPETKDVKPEDKQLSSLEQGTVEQIEEKTRYPGYEVLIRVVASSPTAAKSQVLLNGVVSAFSLFDSSSNNGFKFAVSKNIEELVTAYLFRFFPQEVNQNILNTVELATIFHLPNQNTIPTSQVQRQQAKQVDGPTQQMDEGLLLGYNEFRGVKKPIRLSKNDRRRHTYIIGQTGTGKSWLLENLAFQDMMDGRGFAFIDPHGDTAEKLLGMVPKERVEDVIYFNPGDLEMPIGLNLFDYDNEDQQDFLINESITMFYKLYDPGRTGMVGPRFETWFRNGAKTLMSDPSGSSMIDVLQLFMDQPFADQKIKHVKNRIVLDFWHKEMAQTPESAKGEILGWFASKFGAFLANDMMRNIIGQTKSGFKIREVMDDKKILLVNLSKGKIGELNSNLLGMIFMMKFQAAAMSRADMAEDKREDFSLYVDEFQNFASDSFETILSEARKYRLTLVLANQFMTQLTEGIREAIIGNVGTIISGRIGISDAEIMVKKFAPTFDAEDLTKLPNFQTITSVMINNVPSAAFSMSLPPSMGESNPELRDAIIRLSAAKYGRPRAEVEREIFARLGSGDEARKAKMEALKKAQEERMQAMSNGHAGMPPGGPMVPSAPTAASAPGSSFLDEWLAKRQQLTADGPRQSAPDPAFGPTTGQQVARTSRPSESPVVIEQSSPQPQSEPSQPVSQLQSEGPVQQAPAQNPDRFHIRDEHKNTHHEVSLKLRDED